MWRVAVFAVRVRVLGKPARTAPPQAPTATDRREVQAWVVSVIVSRGFHFRREMRKSFFLCVSGNGKALDPLINPPGSVFIYL